MAERLGCAPGVVRRCLRREGFVERVRECGPAPVLLASTIERRLEQLAHEALETVAEAIYSSADSRLRVKAASTLLQAYQWAQAAGEIPFVAAAAELDPVVPDLLLGNGSRAISEGSEQ
jgi:hypothetical protein